VTLRDMGRQVTARSANGDPAPPRPAGLAGAAHARTYVRTYVGGYSLHAAAFEFESPTQHSQGRIRLRLDPAGVCIAVSRRVQPSAACSSAASSAFSPTLLLPIDHASTCCG
jgi:hypothetical protein